MILQIKYRLILIILMSLLLIGGCEDIIQFETENTGRDLIIFGRFTNVSEHDEVKVSITTPFDGPSIPIRFAEVVVKDTSGNSEVYSETNEVGVYKPTDATLERIPGKQYFLEVCTPNRKMYRSEIQSMPEITGKDSVYFGLEEELQITNRGQEVSQLTVKIFLDSEINRSGNGPVYYRWDVEEVYSFQEAQLLLTKFPFWRWKTCFITNPVDAQKFFLFDESRLQNDDINRLEMASRPADGTYLTRHYFNVTRYSLGFDSFDYWRKVSQLTDRVGSIFDNPSATLESNIVNTEDSDEVVFGFFEVGSAEVSRVLVTRNDIPFLFEQNCALSAEINNVPVNCFSCLNGLVNAECLDCLKIKNSTTERPDYF